MRVWNNQENLLPVETYPYPPPDAAACNASD